MTIEMSVEDILSEIPTEDLHNVGVVRLLIMPPSFVQKHILPGIKVRKALKQSNESKVPGGIETSILFSIFDQSVMDFSKSTSKNIAENNALRARVNHAKMIQLINSLELRGKKWPIQRHNYCAEAACKYHTAAKTKTAVGYERPRDRSSK
jgi:hypothetical protein